MFLGANQRFFFFLCATCRALLLAIIYLNEICVKTFFSVFYTISVFFCGKGDFLFFFFSRYLFIL